MTHFFPEPLHDVEWWGNIQLSNPLGMPNKFGTFEIEDITQDNWLAFGNFISEWYPPVEGYPIVFPTATDCLMWVRWYLLPYECDNEEYKTGKEVILIGKPKEIAERIDAVPSGTNSDELLKAIREDVIHSLENGDFELYNLRSSQEYLDDQLDFADEE